MAKDKGGKTQEDVRSHVRERYGNLAGKAIQGAPSPCCGQEETSASDVESSTSSCCGPEDPVQIDLVSKLYEATDVNELPDEVTDISLGCGDPVTLASLEPGQTVLDLGSGGGIDCFLAAKRVGETGRVIGVDMTAEMVELARKNKEKIGADNVDFRLGEIENLPVSDNTVDVIISNCVINLSPDKPQVFREAFRVMKPGGRLAVSDIVTDGPLPQVIKDNMSAWASCVAGALDKDDYVKAIQDAGFVDVELTPTYLDEEMVTEVAGQLDIETNPGGDGNGKPRAKLVIMEGDDVKEIELDGSADFDPETVQKSIFSAKVTARKPG
jgi:SAM-dependent methyltransferase